MLIHEIGMPFLFFLFGQILGQGFSVYTFLCYVYRLYGGVSTFDACFTTWGIFFWIGWTTEKKGCWIM